jgi:hypothetical protein
MKPTPAAETPDAKKSEFDIGDVVAYKPGSGVLRCGRSSYVDAVVVGNSPFVLCSKDAKMIWSATVAPENFVKVGRAVFIHIRKIRKRLQEETRYGFDYLKEFNAAFPPPAEADKIRYNSPERMVSVPADLLEKLVHAARLLSWDPPADAASVLLLEGYSEQQLEAPDLVLRGSKIPAGS